MFYVGMSLADNNKSQIITILEEIKKTILDQNPQFLKIKEYEQQTKQKEILKSFYQNKLPFDIHQTENVNFLFGDFQIEKTRPDLKKEDNSKTDPIYILGVSGCGKTSSIYQLSKSNFVLFFTACSLESIYHQPFPQDKSFQRLCSKISDWNKKVSNESELDSLLQSLINSDPPTFRQQLEDAFKVEKTLAQIKVKQDFYMRKVINYYTELMILARIIYLIWLLEKNPQLSPQQFINLQLDSGSSRIDEIYYELIDKFKPINFLGSTLEICDLFITKLNTLLKERKFLKLYIALDEANTLTKDSRFILSKRKLEKRGIIKPIFFTFNKICFRYRFQLIVSGTALSLSDCSQLMSAIGKEDFEKGRDLRYITNFLPFKEKEIKNFLNYYLNLEQVDQQVLNRLKIELSGRPRWVCRFISELWKYLDKNNNNNDNNNNNNNNKLIDKNEVLINILDEKIYKIAENDLGNKLKRIEKEEKLKPLGKILQDLFYEYILQNKTSFKPNLIGETSESNEKLWLKILDQGFFYLKQDKGNEFHYIPSDYLALYVLKKHYTTLDILKDKIIQMWEMEQQNYGTAFEWLIFYQLMKFNGLKISELPFFDQVKKKDQKKLPKWIRETSINIQYFSKNQNRNQNYSYKSNKSGAKQDLNMLKNSIFKHHNSTFDGKNQIYIFPSYSMRCDGIIHFGDNCFILIGAKYHKKDNKISSEEAFDNIETTNFLHQFLKIQFQKGNINNNSENINITKNKNKNKIKKRTKMK
ncbi:hypothetical protein M0813_16752 [Anaeramoeba flamelloides]|uniref:Uncharacterized protein n=1 Tax=Anaeramoeba flamelloides TaxID=1746091 RepID=A0ABQ8YYQ5_9EUKA|nr:hypothetical protein M0813_16752 [Anaeramoeba flamelloides]